MKKILLTSLVALFTFSTMTVFGQLSMSPEKIVPGDQVKITYDPQGTVLEGQESIVTNVFLFENSKPTAMEVPMSLDQGKFTGSFTADKSTKAILFYFTNEDLDKNDNNDKKGYKTICYQADRKTPVEGAYASKAYIVGQFSWMADMDRNNEKAMKLFDKEFKHHPASINNLDYQGFYTSLAKANKNEAVLKSGEAKMKEIMAKKKPSKEELSFAYSVSRTMENKEAMETIKSSILKHYPKGSFAANQLTSKMRGAKEVADKIAILEEYKTKFSKLDNFDATVSSLTGQVASAYSKVEDWDNFRKYFDMVTNKSRKAGSLNSITWPMTGESLAGEAKNVPMARKLSKESLSLLKEEMKTLDGKPEYYTKRQYERNLKSTYAMYADTYALLAYKDGDAADALKHQQISCDNNKFADGEMNQRYCAYFEKVNSTADTEKLVAGLIAEGKASSMMKEQHKRLYMANNTLESAYDKYVVELEKSALAKMKEELKEQMMELAAPEFSLVNLAGEQVSLESLKGKVVVVDFWATWCGPCKASFPGMQKAVDKFERSNDVEFVFIDTWESGKDKEAQVSKFIDSKGYSFNVLMDNESKVVADFGVSGIPTKFILDKNGMIRFKSVGFGGNDEALVNELSMMIEMIGGTIPGPVTGAP